MTKIKAAAQGSQFRSFYFSSVALYAYLSSYIDVKANTKYVI